MSKYLYLSRLNRSLTDGRLRCEREDEDIEAGLDVSNARLPGRVVEMDKVT